MLLSYTLEEYESEITSAKEAFLNAAGSQEPVSVAAFQSLQTAFPTAGFQVKDGALVRSSFDEHDRALLDDVLRLLLVRLAGEAVSKGVAIMQYDGRAGKGGPSLMKRLLEMIKWMAVASTAHEVTATSPRVVDVASYCKLLEDLLELGTISDCQDVFACMEADLEFLASEAVPSSDVKPSADVKSSAAQLTILRACNSLLRRLSKANDVQLCGRILVFIARLYPLTDKSGLNLRGITNAGLPLPIDEVAPDDVDSVGQPVDAKLYSVFWGLQLAFQNPAQLLQPGPWNRVREDLQLVLRALDSLPVTVPATGLGTGGAGAGLAAASSHAAAGSQQQLMELDDPDHTKSLHPSAAAVTSVKHLTSSKLFGLQVRDGTFRRHFLVQAAVLLHYLTYPPSNASIGRAEGVDELNSQVFAALCKTDHAGEEFAGAVKSVLEHETQWVAWKKENCPPFERMPEPSAAAAAGFGGAAAGHLGGAAEAGVRPAKRRRPQHDGRGGAAAARPTFAQMVLEPVDQMVGLKAAERTNMPGIKEMLEPLVQDMDPENCIEEEYRHKNDRVFAWKAHRLLARNHLVHFAASKDLEEMMLKIDPELRKKVEDHKAAEEERARKEKEEAAKAEQRSLKEKEEAAKAEQHKEQSTQPGVS